MRARLLAYLALYLLCAEVAWRSDFMAAMRDRSPAFFTTALYLCLRILLLVGGPPLIAFGLTKSLLGPSLKK